MGFRYRPDWAPGDPALRRIFGLMAPATVGLAAVQINIFVNSYFASFEEGAVSWLSYAFRILYLPIGIFGVAAGTVATTSLAKSAARATWTGVRATLRRSLLFLAFLTLPATAGLIVLARPVVRLLYERGRFGPEATEGTAAALAFYAIGLVAYTSVKVLAPAFYALGTPRVPLLASGLAVLTNLTVNVALHGQYRLPGGGSRHRPRLHRQRGPARRACSSGASAGSSPARPSAGSAGWRLRPWRMARCSSCPSTAWLDRHVRDPGPRGSGLDGPPAGRRVGWWPTWLLARLLRMPEAASLLDLVRRGGAR